MSGKELRWDLTNAKLQDFEQELKDTVLKILAQSKGKKKNLTYEVYAVFNKETNEKYSQWFSRKHDAINRKAKDFGWCQDEIKNKYYVARVKFTAEEFEIIEE